jgi:hypothetical protein
MPFTISLACCFFVALDVDGALVVATFAVRVAFPGAGAI